ncbi:MAG TPA: 4Fe-4S dicluster domain-containing protein, partial [Polyangiaceae bacterium]
VFSGLADSALDWLLAAGNLRHLKPRERFSKGLEHESESYCFVLRGVMGITLDPAVTGQPAAVGKAGKRPPKEQRFLGYFEAGACFSNAFLSSSGASPSSNLDCVASNAVTLLQIETSHLHDLLAQQAPWRAKLANSIATQRQAFLSQQAPARQVVQDFFLRENFVTSSIVRVGRLDRCLDCNKCYDACVERHGTPRMARFGPTLGQLTFPVVCRSCHEQPCIEVCTFGTIARDAATGDVQISDSCVGCGKCAKHCPNDAISIVSRPAANGKGRKAVKCDHCAGYSDQACLTACPTGALIEVSTDEVFGNASSNPAASAFSEDAFIRGFAALPPQTRRIEALKTWGAIVTIVLLVAIGFECFMIRTQPERSWLGQVVRATGAQVPVSFTSGRGIGHWLGYIGASLMLASVLYSLRTRVNRFRTWGSQTGWLSAHLWLGFTGAVLVTYHSALKLDRWAGIACYLMWFAVLTGAVGRYVYGWVHSSVGLAHFELAQTKERCRRFAQGCATKRAIDSLFADGEVRAKRWTLAVVLLEELRDRVALVWVWALGTKHLASAKERREMVDCLAAWAANRRRSHYAANAKAILKHWNIIHIIVAIAMFILAGIHIVYGFLYKAV